MKLKKWEYIPKEIKNDCVKEYYDILNKKKLSLLIKRIFDILLSILLLILLFPVFLIISILIAIDSKGPILFKQTRITQYGEKFEIYKFRTMVKDADKIGSQVTQNNDVRITKIGAKLRGLRLDELPQLMNVLLGDMSFVGARPEVEKYVDFYTDEMKATLLLPAGITSNASIMYKDEAKILNAVKDIDETYINIILPEKMKYNLEAIKKFSLLDDLKVMIKTIFKVLN
ncbi:sugar transferase [Clostridium perfringens]|uniref:sugar transferase n=1 Tax=Clostridium perfringens TaxID=1502 RepID=UPI00214D1F7A|nr:sugar transferase [Clostridium perfringens]MDM0608544.1 sugar transferase [Clostridium perfringens]UUW66449.1 sugar transferase [Clostridium perfringens]